MTRAFPFKAQLQRVYGTAVQFTNPLRWPRVPLELAWYLRDLARFRRGGSVGLNGPVEFEPILFQRALNSPFDSHYTWQAAWATKRVVRKAPPRHVDVSSSVPYVVQLASVLPVTFYEFNPPALVHPDITVQHATVVDLPLESRSVESLSCLHVIEHIGLGRYGDPIDPDGADRALRELSRVIAPGGQLLVSAPVGRARVAFNAHRVLDAGAVVRAVEGQGLSLAGFAYVDDAGQFHDPARPEDTRGLRYGCGMFEFVRPAADSARAAGT